MGLAILTEFILNMTGDAKQPKGYFRVKSVGELVGALRAVTNLAVNRAGPNHDKLRSKNAEIGRDVAGNDLPQTDWQKSVEASVQDETYQNDVSSCEELDRQFEEE